MPPTPLTLWQGGGETGQECGETVEAYGVVNTRFTKTGTAWAELKRVKIRKRN
jgi:hypothetical protein